MKDSLTSQWTLHGGLDKSGQQLEGLGILGKSAAEGSQGICMAPQALESHSLAVVRLADQRTQH